MNVLRGAHPDLDVPRLLMGKPTPHVGRDRQLAMLDFDEQVWLHTGHSGEEVIEDLLGSHTELAAARADFQPAFFIAKIALGEIFGSHQNQIAVVGEFHGAFEFKTRTPGFARRSDLFLRLLNVNTHLSQIVEVK